MLKFLKKYLYTRNDKLDAERISEFMQRLAKLHISSLSYIYNFSMKMEALVTAFSRCEMLRMSEPGRLTITRLKHVYPAQDDKYALSHIIASSIEKLVTTPEFEDLNKSDLMYEYDRAYFYNNANKYLEQISKNCLLEPQYSTRLNLLQSKDYLFSHREDSTLCENIDFVIGAEKDQVADSFFALKKIFLTQDDTNFEAMTMMRNGIIGTPVWNHIFGGENSDKKFANLIELFSSDAKLVGFFIRRNMAALISGDKNFDLKKDPKQLSLYILTLIYARRLLALAIELLVDLPDQNIYDKGVGVYFIRKYIALGYIIYQYVYDDFSIQDSFSYVLKEINFDVRHKFNFQDPIYKTDKFESFINQCRSDMRSSKFDKYLDLIALDAEKYLKANPDKFHNDVIARYFSPYKVADSLLQEEIDKEDKPFTELQKILTEIKNRPNATKEEITKELKKRDIRLFKGFRIKVTEKIKEIIRKLKIGRIRGEKKES